MTKNHLGELVFTSWASWTRKILSMGFIWEGNKEIAFSPAGEWDGEEGMIYLPGWDSCAGKANQLPGKVCAICGKAFHAK